MPDAFHFLRPLWLLAFVPLALLVWYWIKRTQTESSWQRSIDDNLLGVLLDDTARSGQRWLRASMLVALTITLLGLAGPTWEKLPQNVEQKNDALVIVLDLSLSMLAADTQPSRIERARQKITDVLRLRTEGQTALIAYAGDAHAVVPLTDDNATITNLLVALSPEMMPVFGSNPDHALTLAHELFDNSRIQQGRILLITDGIDNINDVSRHRSRAYPISILGIGTPEGAPIPLDRVRQPGRFLRTQEGNQIIALLDESRLQEVAQMTFGHYATSAVGDSDILHTLAAALPGEDESIEVEREFDTWFDQGHWAALLLLPLMLMGFRKGVFITVVCAALLPAPPAHAEGVTDLWDSLWWRSDQRGVQALSYGEPEKAATLFDGQSPWKPIADYRSGDYSASLNGFRDDPSLTGRYNEANTLARLGEYEAAIEQYQQVLTVQPEHEDAMFNKALVERLLEEQQKAEQQQNQDQQSQGNNEDGDDPQDNQQQQQDEQSAEEEADNAEEREQESAEPPEQSEQQGQEQQMAEAEEDEASRDERQDALEQWLRRVPDDPGGLLRRKFSHETKQRLRRGERPANQGDKIW